MFHLDIRKEAYVYMCSLLRVMQALCLGLSLLIYRRTNYNGICSTKLEKKYELRKFNIEKPGINSLVTKSRDS